MILGLGLDVVNIGRFSDHLDDRMRERLFRPEERDAAPGRLAGVFAAKEAVIKALGGVVGFSWHDVLVAHTASGRPVVVLSGATARAAAAAGVTAVLVSISHDDPVAAATIVLEGNTRDHPLP